MNDFLRNAFIVANREFRSVLSSKSYWLSMFLLPLVLIISAGFGWAFRAANDNSSLPLAVVDKSGILERNADAQGNYVLRSAGEIDGLKAEVRKGLLSGILVLEENNAQYFVKRNLTPQLPTTVSKLIQEHRLRQANVDPRLLSGMDVRTVALEQVRSGYGRVSAALTIYAILSLSIALHGTKLTMSLLEEKRTKIVEILLSTVHPLQFMWGKITGSASAAMLQTGVWAVSIFGAAYLASHAIARFITGGARAIAFDPGLVFWLVVFSVLGFLLYATLFAAIGAIATSVTEAQYMETPLVFLLLFPSYMFWPLVQNPEGTMVVAGSYFPFFTPFVMYARMCVGEAGFLEATLGAGIMLVAIFVNVLLVSAIYRAGFLIYGKRPSFMEIGKAIVFSLSLPVPKLAFLKPRKAQTEAR